MNRILLALVVLLPAHAQAGDWPQILGPLRNGTAVGEQIAKTWPEGGPKVLWQCPAGSGWAGPSVADGRVFLFHRINDEEIVEAHDAATGKQLWREKFPASYVPSYTDDDGPRAVPLVDGGRLWCYGARGDLRCLDAASGRLIWKRDTFADFNSGRPSRGEPADGYFGIATSPILEGDKLLVNIGGDTNGAGIVAFDAATGRTVWKSTAERASYSSPVAATIDGIRHVIFATRLSVVSVDPATGAVRFQFDFGRRGPTVTAACPVLLDDHLLITASYGIGSAYARIGARQADVLWRDAEILASQYTTCVEHGGRLFGIDGRQDGPPASLRCIDPTTRKVLWTQAGFGYATLMKVNDRLLIMRTDGTLILAAANPERYEELARAEVADTTVRALPAPSDGRFYVRDTRTLKCFDLRSAGETSDDVPTLFNRAASAEGIAYLQIRDAIVARGAEATAFLTEQSSDKDRTRRILAAAMLDRIREPQKNLRREELVHGALIHARRCEPDMLTSVLGAASVILRKPGAMMMGEGLGAEEDLPPDEQLLEESYHRAAVPFFLELVLKGAIHAPRPEDAAKYKFGFNEVDESHIRYIAKHPDYGLWARWYAAAMVGRLENPDVVPVLTELYRFSKDAGLRSSALAGLGRTKYPRVVETLITALADDDRDVRGEAEYALRKITKQDFGLDQQKWQAWWKDGGKGNTNER